MNVSTQSLRTTLASLIQGPVRVAETSDAILGVQPQVVAEPSHEEEVAAILRFAHQEGLKVVVRGGGTQLDLGFAPTQCDIILSTTALHQVVEHAPQDLTVTVQAGLALTELQTVLARSRQWLALDPALEPAATIGGIVATNASGPRRLRYGGVRDQIIGVRVVLPDGTIAKGGGKVVKNVAGYDLPKLYTGSLGTLGVIVATSFRLYPFPESSCTVVIAASSFAPLCELAVRILDSPLVPTILDCMPSPTQAGDYVLAVRFEMSREATNNQAARCIEMAAQLENGSNSPRVLRDADEVNFWSQAAKANTPVQGASASLMLKASLLPTDVAHWLASFEQRAQSTGLTANWRAHVGHGMIFASLAADAHVLYETVMALRQEAMSRRGSVVITKAAPVLLPMLDVWGESPTLSIMRRLKARFDPHATLNIGRFVGGI